MELIILKTILYVLIFLFIFKLSLDISIYLLRRKIKKMKTKVMSLEPLLETLKSTENYSANKLAHTKDNKQVVIAIGVEHLLQLELTDLDLEKGSMNLKVSFLSPKKPITLSQEETEAERMKLSALLSDVVTADATGLKRISEITLVIILYDKMYKHIDRQIPKDML